MPRGINPYYANEGRYAGVGQAVGNLGQVFLQMNDPSNLAKADALGWQARGDREQVIDTQRTRASRDQLGDIFATMDPNTFDQRQVLSEAVRGDVYDPNQIGDLFRVAQSNVPGFSDDQVARSVIGAGGDIGKDDAFSLTGQQNIADRNFGYENDLAQQKQAADYRQAIDLQNQKPLSRDQMIGQLFQTQGPEAAQEGVASMYAPRATGAGSDPLVSAKRRADLEDLLMSEMATQLGPEVAEIGVPPELRGEVVTEALRLVEQEGLAPIEAITQVLGGLDVSTQGTGWFDGDPRVEYAPKAQQAPAPIQPGAVEDGYEFLGGDPSQPQNWRKVN